MLYLIAQLVFAFASLAIAVSWTIYHGFVAHTLSALGWVLCAVVTWLIAMLARQAAKELMDEINRDL